MRYFAVILTVLLLPFFCLSCGNKHQSYEEIHLTGPDPFPKEFKSRDELAKTFGKRILFGAVNRAEFCQWGRQIFAVWYDPLSGRDVNELHAYYYDPSKSRWILFIYRAYENAGDLSAEMSPDADKLIIRDADGDVVLEQSVTNLPAEDWSGETNQEQAPPMHIY